MINDPTRDSTESDVVDLRFGSTLMDVLEELGSGYAAAGRGYVETLRNLGYPQDGAERIAAAFVVEMQTGMIQAAWGSSD